MDRPIVYAGSIPLETDILTTNRNAMVAMGRLTMDMLGTSTLASGLACTQTSVASMSVAIGAGAIYSLQNIDSSAYSSLPANTADQIMKQGILTAASAKTLALTAPVSSGTSIIYLIEGAFSEVDAIPVTLPYYNASNPTSAYSGPGGTGVPQNTVRQGQVNIQSKAGIAASSPVAPAVDSGFVPLYYVTVAYGATTVTNANIAVATGAPFIPSTLASMMPLAGGTFTGPVLGQTPAATDVSTKLATTAFIQSLFTKSTSANGYQKLPGGLIIQWGNNVTFTSQSLNTITFPIAFPTGGLQIYATLGTTISLTSVTSAVGAQIISATQAQIAISSTSPGTLGASWLAIGY